MAPEHGRLKLTVMGVLLAEGGADNPGELGLLGLGDTNLAGIEEIAVASAALFREFVGASN